MISPSAIRFAAGIIGNITALFLFLSPLPTFIGIHKKKTVGQYSSVPYLATFVNCMLWVVYGLPFIHPNSILVVTINGAGFFIELIYLILFVIYSDKKNKLKIVLIAIVEIIIVGIMTALVLGLTHTTKRRSSIVGMIAIVCNIMMYASPLSVMKLVITTKSVEYMPFSLSIASFTNGIAWTVYALFPLDPYIASPVHASSREFQPSISVVAFYENLVNSTLNVGINYNDPYYLASGDNPSMQLGNQILTGSNYINWCRIVRMALIARNKICFVDGTLIPPDSASDDHKKWLRNDYMVMSWILNSMEKTIAESFLFVNSSNELWCEIKERFGHTNVPQIQVEQQHKLTTIAYTFEPNALNATRGVCDHCKRTGHTKDRCFTLIGYLEWWTNKPKGRFAPKVAAQVNQVSGILGSALAESSQSNAIACHV
uniref:Retrotransposon Copia-like N-terminal domain-containing protein n=1 Tax=Chenopodium quinoa TaxID=63459 RepID=A0A803LWM9_CHEQI